MMQDGFSSSLTIHIERELSNHVLHVIDILNVFSNTEWHVLLKRKMFINIL